MCGGNPTADNATLQVQTHTRKQARSPLCTQTTTAMVSFVSGEYTHRSQPLLKGASSLIWPGDSLRAGAWSICTCVCTFVYAFVSATVTRNYACHFTHDRCLLLQPQLVPASSTTTCRNPCLLLQPQLVPASSTRALCPTNFHQEPCLYYCNQDMHCSTW